MSGKHHHRVVGNTTKNYYAPSLMYTETLELLGLPKNEAKVYEALLKLGSTGVSKISTVAKVNRRNVYDALKNLEQKLLVICEEGINERLYSAKDPDELSLMLENQEGDISKSLPELEALYKQTEAKSQAFISRGEEAIKNFWRYVVSQKEPVYYVGGKGAWHDKKIETARQDFFKKCQEKGIVIKGIFDIDVLEWGKDVYSVYNPQCIRFFKKMYSTSTTFDVCNERIALFTLPKERSIENSTVFTIISKPLARSFTAWFEVLWNNALPLNKALSLTKKK